MKTDVFGSLTKLVVTQLSSGSLFDWGAVALTNTKLRAESEEVKVGLGHWVDPSWKNLVID